MFSGVVEEKKEGNKSEVARDRGEWLAEPGRTGAEPATTGDLFEGKNAEKSRLLGEVTFDADDDVGADDDADDDPGRKAPNGDEKEEEPAEEPEEERRFEREVLEEEEEAEETEEKPDVP